MTLATVLLGFFGQVVPRKPLACVLGPSASSAKSGTGAATSELALQAQRGKVSDVR